MWEVGSEGTSPFLLFCPEFSVFLVFATCGAVLAKLPADYRLGAQCLSLPILQGDTGLWSLLWCEQIRVFCPDVLLTLILLFQGNQFCVPGGPQLSLGVPGEAWPRASTWDGRSAPRLLRTRRRRGPCTRSSTRRSCRVRRGAGWGVRPGAPESAASRGGTEAEAVLEGTTHSLQTKEGLGWREGSPKQCLLRFRLPWHF